MLDALAILIPHDRKGSNFLQLGHGDGVWWVAVENDTTVTITNPRHTAARLQGLPPTTIAEIVTLITN